MSHKFKKRFGQNFLKSKRFAQEMIEGLNLTETDTVIEIGPGNGFVTNLLLKTNARVICIEVDYSLIPELIKRFNERSNFELVNTDALEVDFEKLLEKFNVKGNVYFTGSLPYNISKKIILNCLEYSVKNSQVKGMSFIVQEEVALHIVAKAPRSNYFSSIINTYADVKKTLTIPAAQFFPEPKVNGAVVFFKPVSKLNADDRKDFLKLTKIAFSSPRKTLRSNLVSSRKYSAENVDEVFKKLILDERIRASEIDFDLWLKIFAVLNAN